MIIKNALDQIKNNFDIIFLGYTYDNEDKIKIPNSIKNYSNNLFKLDDTFYAYGAHAYLVNNNKIDKIIDNIKFIEMPIDSKYYDLAISNKLNIYYLNPKVIDINYSLKSTIVI